MDKEYNPTEIPVDVEYERLKQERKKCRGEDIFILRRMLDHYGQFHAIKKRIEQSSISTQLWWPCVRLEEEMWEAIRRHLIKKGYDRAWIREKDGMFGLKGYAYNDGIPCEYDEILLTYDALERMENPIPVRKDGKCGLVLPDGIGTPVTPFKYDLLFRKPHSEIVKYIAILDGKYGILTTDGNEAVPCEMDCIYDSIDPDGVLPLRRDGKWGFYEEAGEYIAPQFDELSIHSEDYLRVRINETWGWVAGDGTFTKNKDEACYGSWYNRSK